MEVVTKDSLVAEIKGLMKVIHEKTKIGPLSSYGNDIKKMLDRMIEADLISEEDLKTLHFIHRRTPL